MHNLCCDNEFHLHENTNHFHIKGIALGLTLKQRLWATKKCTALPTLSYNAQHSRTKNAVRCCVRLHVESDNVKTMFNQMAIQFAGKRKRANRIFFFIVVAMVLLNVSLLVGLFFVLSFLCTGQCPRVATEKRRYQANSTKKYST